MRGCLLIALCLVACGPAPGTLSLAIGRSALGGGGVQQFQVSFVATNTNFCSIYSQLTCLADQVQASSLAPVFDSHGASHPSWLISVASGTETDTTASVTIGTRYSVVVEGLDATPRVIRSQCLYLQNGIHAGANDDINVNPTSVSPAACSRDPRF